MNVLNGHKYTKNNPEIIFARILEEVGVYLKIN